MLRQQDNPEADSHGPDWAADDESLSLRASDHVVSQVNVHLALLCGQAINGGGAVIAKLGLFKISPILFAFLREAFAAPILCMLAWKIDGSIKVYRQELPLLVAASLALISNQIAFVTGLRLANPVIGSAWQPSQPIFVLVMAVWLGKERCSFLKTLGVLICLVGGATMTGGDESHHDAVSATNAVIGNMFFFFNCFMTAVFVMVMRSVTVKMPAYVGLAAVYTIASMVIAVFAVIVSSSQRLRTFFCADCEGFWVLPPVNTWWALFYWVFGSSVLAYMCLTYGAKHARDPSHCLAYTAVQPLTAAVAESFLISTGWNLRHPEHRLELPGGVQILGAVLVVAGVGCVAADAKIRAPRHGQGARDIPQCVSGPRRR